MDSKLVVFDLDGTLFQSHVTSVQAIKTALRDCHLPVPDDDFIRSLLGGQMEDVCIRLAPQSDAVQRGGLSRQITRHEKELVRLQGTLFDGVENMLKELKQSGYTLAICSNGMEEYIETVLTVCKIRQYFAIVKGKKLPLTKAQRLHEVLTELDPSSAIFVGDRIHDFEAAKENQISSIGVTFGYGGKEILLANHLAENTESIIRIVQDLNSNGMAKISSQKVPVRLRELKLPADIDLAVPWYSDTKSLYFSEGPNTLPFDRTRIEKMYLWLLGKGDVYIVEVFDNEEWVAVGDATLSDEFMPILIGDWRYRNRGVGGRVLELLIQKAKQLDWSKLVAHKIFTYNTRSIRLFEKAGFVKTACSVDDEGREFFRFERNLS